MEARTLGDGLTVWLDPMRDVRSVALGVYVAGGSADEEPSALGSTHFLEHLLFRRSRRRSGAEIARTTDRLGGDCDAYTCKEWMAVHARTPSERLGDALSLLLDLTEAPAFTAEDVETERKVILEEMAEANDVPEDRLHETFVRSYWPDHPLGAPILGTDETVRSLSRSRLVGRFREIFRPERTFLVAVGAFEPEAFLKLLSKERRMRRRSPVPPLPAHAPPRRSPRTESCAFHIQRPDLNQTHLLVGTPAPAYADRQVPAAWLLSVVLGGGVSSRLWRRVRERHGLAYHVGAGLTLHRDGGMALIEAATAPKKLPKPVVDAIDDIWRSRSTPARTRAGEPGDGVGGVPGIGVVLDDRTAVEHDVVLRLGTVLEIGGDRMGVVDRQQKGSGEGDPPGLRFQQQPVKDGIEKRSPRPGRRDRAVFLVIGAEQQAVVDRIGGGEGHGRNVAAEEVVEPAGADEIAVHPGIGRPLAIAAEQVEGGPPEP
mgnify:CR=1 FL=1